MGWMVYEERKQIEKLYSEGNSIAEIAKALNKQRATVYRELERGYTGEMDGNGRAGYSAEVAQKRTFEMRMSSRTAAVEKAV